MLQRDSVITLCSRMGTGEPRQHARHEGPSVIKIRSTDLPQGLRGPVRSGGRRPVISLLPGCPRPSAGTPGDD